MKKKYSLVSKEETSILKRNKEWCSNNNINYAPQTILNNHFFPTEYDITDIAHFVDNLKNDKEIFLRKVD